jgi:NodT family efflux transporter outer membrane factor (OMF) lipoprotein
VRRVRAAAVRLDRASAVWLVRALAVWLPRASAVWLPRASAVSLAGGLAACSFAPVYRSPPQSAPPAAAYLEAGDWKVAEPQDDASRGEWWTVFQDPPLDDLERKVGAANENIKAALARLAQARAETRIQRAGLFPTVTAGSTATRGRVSPNSPRFPAGAEAVGGNFDLEADLSYEFDVWGRVRNTVNSARAAAQASAADLATLDLSLHAELAADYFTLRGEDAQQALLERTVEDYAKSLQLTQNLHEGGGAPLADVEQARAQLETARTQLTETQLQRAQTLHAIALLAGENPSAFRLDALPLTPDASPPAIDPGLPSALLERRPDVAAAERRVAAANFNVGVARAAYFPQFSLAAAFGVDSAHSSNWLSAPSRMWSVGPEGMLTVFDAGRHRAQADQARAAFDEQAADYRNVVLTAYQEVEDDLAALRRLQEESVSQAAAVAATGKALQQSQYRYRAGLVTYLEVATNEAANLQAQLSNVNIEMRRMNASVLLIKALGGGWRGAPAPQYTSR